MVVRVERTDQGLVIPVTAEMARLLDLTEGAQVDVGPVSLPLSGEDVAHYASVEQALTSFERTLLQHENAYRELAK